MSDIVIDVMDRTVGISSLRVDEFEYDGNDGAPPDDIKSFSEHDDIRYPLHRYQVSFTLVIPLSMLVFHQQTLIGTTIAL